MLPRPYRPKKYLKWKAGHYENKVNEKAELPSGVQHYMFVELGEGSVNKKRDPSTLFVLGISEI